MSRAFVTTTEGNLMNNFVVWLDSKNAHIFASSPTGFEKSVLQKKLKDFRPQNKHAEKVDHNAGHFYRDLAVRLRGADQLLLMGPGLAKNKFQDHLKLHQPETLAKKIIGLKRFEDFNHKSEKQLLARAKKFIELSM